MNYTILSETIPVVHITVMRGEPDLSRVRVVLVEPKGPFNIGSVARIMKNMGLSRLDLVNPAEYRNDDGLKAAVGARDVLDSARIFDTLEDAVADTSLVVGTTRRTGKLRRVHCTVEDLPGRIYPALINGYVSILFGREESGLLTSETDLCNMLVRIPSSVAFPSLNLSHAVAVVCYKIFTEAMIQRVDCFLRPAANEEVEGFLDYLQRVFTDIGFFSKGTPAYVVTLFRRIFGRALLEEEEIEQLTHVFHRLHGICASAVHQNRHED
jgi:tRNA/rRNA methyltransferase